MPSRQVVQEPAVVLHGAAEGVIACLMPLAADPGTAAFYQERMSEILGAPSGRTFLHLSLFRLDGEDAPPLQLDPLELRVTSRAEDLEALPLHEGTPSPSLRASTLPLEALESFVGTSLPAGDFLDAVTSLPGSLALDDLDGGVVRAGELEIPLHVDRLDRATLRELLEFPRRETVEASLTGGGAELKPAESTRKR